LIDLIQHGEAIKMNKDYDLTPIAVYDTLFRPMERLIGIDMPLHDLLANARYNMAVRNRLFNEMKSIAGFTLATKLDCHSLFKHLSYTRHLSYDNLSPSNRFGSGPLYHLPPLEPFEEDPKEKPLSSENFQRLENKLERQLCVESPMAEPLVRVPLQPGYLDEFPELGGANMSIAKQRLIANLHNDIVRHEAKACDIPVKDWKRSQQSQQPQPSQQSQQKSKSQDSPSLLMVIPNREEDDHYGNRNVRDELYTEDSEYSPRSYSDAIQWQQMPEPLIPTPIRPLPLQDMDVFPFLRFGQQQQQRK